MERQPRVEELLNKITLLRKALEFYANEKNYVQNVPINNELSSKTEIDNGHQARFALEQTETIEEFNQSLIEEYRKAVGEEKKRFEDQGINEESVEKMEEIINKINKYKHGF
jgi:hypothetical protein